MYTFQDSSQLVKMMKKISLKQYAMHCLPKWSNLHTVKPNVNIRYSWPEKFVCNSYNYCNLQTRSPSLGTSLTALFTSVPLLSRYKTEVNKNSPSLLIKERFNFTDDNILLINDLIEKETKGLIKDVIRPGQLSLDTSMVVMNAFYFKVCSRYTVYTLHEMKSWVFRMCCMFLDLLTFWRFYSRLD